MKRIWSLVSSSSSSDGATATRSSTSSNKKRTFISTPSSHRGSGCSSIQSQDVVVVVSKNTTTSSTTSTTTESMTPPHHHSENAVVTYRSPSLVSLQSDVVTVASSTSTSTTSPAPSPSPSPSPSLPQYDDDKKKCQVIQSKFRSKSNNNNCSCSCILTACSCPDLVESHQAQQQQTAEEPSSSSSSSTLLLTMLPNEILELCLSFLVLSSSSSNDSSQSSSSSFFSSVRSDRRNIQLTCKQLKECSQSPFLLREMNLCGDLNTGGKHSFILDSDTRESALQRLYPFVMARNVHAFHMVGMIEAYCFDNVTAGLLFLSESARCGYNPSRYVLGIMLRESNKNESFRWLQDAASDGYIPALQEILPANEMKDRFGDLSADELKKYFLDHFGVMKLMRRNYCHPHHSHSNSSYSFSSSQHYHYQCSPVVNMNSSRSRYAMMASSHCWNPLCGKWAYKGGVGVAGSVNVNVNEVGVFNNEQGRNFLTMYSHLVSRTAAAGERETNGAVSSSSTSSLGSMGSTTAPVFLGHANTTQPASCTFISSNNINNNINNNNVVIVGPTDNHSATNNAAPANDDDATTASSCTIPTSNTSTSTTFLSSPTTNNTNSNNTNSLFLQELLLMRIQPPPMRVARMKMCSVCRRAKYCSKLCQVYDWRSGRHKQECRLL